MAFDAGNRPMSLAQELERLAKLRSDGVLTAEEFDKAKKQLLSAPSQLSGFVLRGLRRQSSRMFAGLPLWSIAIGPDLERGEMRGHARGIFALGDIATGWVAFGGFARGFIAMGGLAVGLIAFGGGAVGILIALGGGAIGGIAFGGAAVGLVAIGGGAFGYYAMGGAAAGVHAVSALSRDPAATEFFQKYFPWLGPFFRMGSWRR
jgi:putative oligomerization/nucleic acid binding protein